MLGNHHFHPFKTGCLGLKTWNTPLPPATYAAHAPYRWEEIHQCHGPGHGQKEGWTCKAMHLSGFFWATDGWAEHTQPQTPDGSRTYAKTIHVAGDVGNPVILSVSYLYLFSSGTLKEKSPRSWDGDWNFRKCLKLLEKVKASYYPPWNINMEPKNQQNHLPTNRFLGFNMLIFPGCSQYIHSKNTHQLHP